MQLTYAGDIQTWGKKESAVLASQTSQLEEREGRILFPSEKNLWKKKVKWGEMWQQELEMDKIILAISS